MKIEKLEFNKIRITLLLEDLQMYNINVKKINPNSPELHSFLCEIMKLVSLKTNFNPFDGQVIVEATPSDEGLVLMLSKVGMQVQVSKKIRAVKKKKHEYICCFENFAAFGEFSKICGNDYPNAALYEYKNKIYFIFEAEKPNPQIKEFCSLYRNPPAGREYLAEHGKFIADSERLENIITYFKGE